MEERIMRRVADSAVIQTQLVLNSHLNGAGRLFGGQLMEWIDIVATVVARRHAHCNPTTASVDNLQFKEAVHLNNTLIIEGKLTYVGRTSMEVRVDTFVESLSGARKLVNTAYVVMVALDENIFMHGRFTDPKFPCRLPHCRIVVYDVISDRNRPFLDIFLHGSSPENVFYILLHLFPIYANSLS